MSECEHEWGVKVLPKGQGSKAFCKLCGERPDLKVPNKIKEENEPVLSKEVKAKLDKVTEGLTMKEEDNVNHPPHYTNHPSGIECIDITEHMGFNLGNVMKYVWRADLKNGIEDLKKAQWYLNREIMKRDK